MKKYMKTLVRF